MKLKIPKGYGPLLAAAAIVGLACASFFIVDVFDIGEDGAVECCATEFDPSPFERTP